MDQVELSSENSVEIKPFSTFPTSVHRTLHPIMVFSEMQHS